MDNNDIKLLYAKDAIFKLIGQYCRCFKGNDGNYYMSDYYESALERSFSVLGFNRDEVPLMEFCQAWEDNNRKIWSANFPDLKYECTTAKTYYEIFLDDYMVFLKEMEEDDEDSY